MNLKKKLTYTILFAAIGTIGLVLIDGETKAAKAGLAPAACYKLASTESPAADNDGQVKHETWCYKDLDEPQGARLIYNIDSNGHTKPELSMIVEADSTLRHASLRGGKLTFHRLRSLDFNPLGVPLTPPADAERVSEPLTPSSAASTDKSIRIFQEHGNVPLSAAIVREGTFKVSVPQEAMPWRGYWYPYSSQRMHNGDDSPFAKYDRFVARRAVGANPGGQAWEKKHHLRGRGWSGHCNGWAAASVMHNEPTVPIKDPFGKIMFKVSDQKALLIERSYCPKIVFYGRRNYGKPENDPRDIEARTLHNVLTYFIGTLKKPVLIDIDPGVPVHNSVVSGYTMTVKKIGSNTYDVKMRARVHLYDTAVSEELGIARSVIKNYDYTLYTDDNSRALSGSWNSKNPDFLWVPLSDGNCEERNPSIEPFWIAEIARFGPKPPTERAQPPVPSPDATPAPEATPDDGSNTDEDPGEVTEPVPAPTPEPTPDLNPEPTPFH